MTPLAIAAGVGAGFGGAFVDKKGPIFAIILSGILSMIGFFLFPFWVEAKWHFIVASIVAGVGMGMILGAPLNILATEGIKKDKGTSIATLSLVRQIGMTLAPTIYAGFIARGFNDMPTLFATAFPEKLQANLTHVTLSSEAQAEIGQFAQSFTEDAAFSQETISTAIANIQDPTLKELMTSTVTDMTTMAAQNGYGGLFMSASIISILILVTAFILAFIRKKYISSTS